MTDTVTITFVGGPLGGQRREYEVPSPALIEQPFDIPGNPEVAEVHVYQVNKLFGCANWIAMKLRMRSGDRVYNCEPDMHPDRDDYNHLEYDSHQAQMIAFVQELEALRAKYGIEMDYESCYECGGMARWQLGAVTVNVGDEDAWWRRESS